MSVTITVDTAANRPAGERKALASASNNTGRLTATRNEAVKPSIARAAAPATAPAADRAEISSEARQETASPRNRLGELLDLASLATNPMLTLSRRSAELAAIQNGTLNPANDTRLGSYEATVGHERGTVGRGANKSIAAIYLLLGTFGQDSIGNVFNSNQAQSTLSSSVSSEDNNRLARTEFDYWQNQWNNDGSAGGFMGSMFNPTVRAEIQSWMSQI